MLKTIGKLCYVAVAVFFLYAAIKGGRQTSKDSLKYIKENMVVVEDGVLDTTNEGKLVMVSGKVTADKKALLDEEFDVQVENVVFLNRISEQYRWYTYEVEEKYTEYEYDDDGYRREVERTRTKTYLTKGWQIADNKKEEDVYFNGKSHYNPASTMKSLYLNNKIYLGDYELTDENFNRTAYSDKFEYYSDLKDGHDDNMGDYKVLTNDGKTYLTTGNELWDYRVSFVYLPVDKIDGMTIIGKQEGNKIVRYDSGKVNVFKNYNEFKNKEDFIAELENEYKSAKLGIFVVIIILAIVGYFVLRI